MSLSNPSFVANGTIQPCRIVKLDVTAGVSNDLAVVQASADTDTPVGISQEGAHDPPGTVGAATDAARAGQSLKVYGIGDIALLEITAAGVTRGDFLVSDANGRGVTMGTGAGVFRKHVGIALETSTTTLGEKIRVLIVLGGVKF